MGRLIDADAFKEDLKKGTEFALGREMVRGTLTKEKEKQVDETLKGFLEDIDAQPTADRWVPVEKGLPKDGETVLVITKCGQPLICDYDKYQKTWISDKWMVIYYTEEIKKWQPYSPDEGDES